MYMTRVQLDQNLDCEASRKCRSIQNYNKLNVPDFASYAVFQFAVLLSLCFIQSTLFPFQFFYMYFISEFLKVRENKNYKCRNQRQQGCPLHEIYVNDVLVNGLYLCLGYLSFKIMVAHMNQCLKGNLNILSYCLLIQKGTPELVMYTYFRFRVYIKNVDKHLQRTCSATFTEL